MRQGLLKIGGLSLLLFSCIILGFGLKAWFTAQDQHPDSNMIQSGPAVREPGLAVAPASEGGATLIPIVLLSVCLFFVGAMLLLFARVQASSVGRPARAAPGIGHRRGQGLRSDDSPAFFGMHSLMHHDHGSVDHRRDCGAGEPPQDSFGGSDCGGGGDSGGGGGGGD